MIFFVLANGKDEFEFINQTDYVVMTKFIKFKFYSFFVHKIIAPDAII